MRSGNHYAPLFAMVMAIPSETGFACRSPRAATFGDVTLSRVPGLADKRLVFVTGKGGVGKSTVAIALGIATARRGLRTIVAELSGQARAAETFGTTQRAEPGLELRLAENLHATS